MLVAVERLSESVGVVSSEGAAFRPVTYHPVAPYL